MSRLTRRGAVSELLDDSLVNMSYLKGLVLRSDAVAALPERLDGFISLSENAEIILASSDLVGGVPVWQEIVRNYNYGLVYFFPEIEEGLPLYKKVGTGFERVFGDDAHASFILSCLKFGGWGESNFQTPPEWASLLYVSIADLYIHKCVFSAVWDINDSNQAALSRKLRIRLFEAFVSSHSSTSRQGLITYMSGAANRVILAGDSEQSEICALTSLPQCQRQDISQAKEKTYQNIIGSMLELMVGESKEYPKLAALVAALVDVGHGKYGMSESNLNRKLPECKRAFNAE